MYVRELIRTHMPTASPEMSLQEVLDIMDIHQMILVPIVQKDGSLVGTLGEEDILLLLQTQPHKHLLQQKVVHHMCREETYLQEESTLEEALDIIVRTKKRRIPVLNAKGRYVGLLSVVDIFRAALEVTNASQ